MTQATVSSPIRARPVEPESNIKETVEQILIAFILAFIFRCFIVEAFVIPTGSMAPTLLGAHMDFRCPDCGWNWKVNYSGDNDGDDVSVPSQAGEVYPIRCPNCGYKLPRNLPNDPANDASFPTVQYGDRILVQKYMYLLHDPNRWDVVVFKTPDSGGAPVEPYTQNYIKRLVGKPNETILVLDGDVYVAPAKASRDKYVAEDFTVQTKPHDVQEAMWRVIYDNDYRPRGLPRVYLAPANKYDEKPRVELSESEWQQPWTPEGDGWKDNGRTFTFDAADKSGRLDFDTSRGNEKHAMTDWLGYDVSYMVHELSRRSNKDFFRDETYPTLNNVSDVKLALNYQRTGGTGPLRLKLTKLDYVFTAELTPTNARLLMKGPGETEAKEVINVPFKDNGRNRRLEFQNVDYRVSLRIDGREVFATTPQQFKPNVAGLLADFAAGKPHPPAAVSIEAANQQSSISHLSLWRDVYYLNRDWSNSHYYWAMPDNFPLGSEGGRLMELGPDEFFVMGDNSMLSSDARVWTSQVHLPYEQLDVDGGRVPRRFLLGKAFFVYWPAGYAPISSLPGFVPNFGEMRFIH